MRVRLLSFLPILLATAAVPAVAGPLKPDEARNFVAGKLFSYTCFEGTQGTGRIFQDGSVVGTMQPRGRPPRFVALPAGTIKVGASSICASVKGLMFEPCFEVNQTSAQSFRGTVSGLSFAYCDFVKQNPRSRLTAGTEKPRPIPVGLRPSTTGVAPATAPVRSAGVRED